jgi:hypothetical protein
MRRALHAHQERDQRLRLRHAQPAAGGPRGRAFGLGTDIREVTVSLVRRRLLLRPVPKHPGIVLHLVTDASIGNATLAHRQLERIDAA